MMFVHPARDVGIGRQMQLEGHGLPNPHAHAAGGCGNSPQGLDPGTYYSNSPTAHVWAHAPPSVCDCCDPLLIEGCCSRSPQFGSRICLRCHSGAGSPPTPTRGVTHRACSPPPARPLAIYTRGSRLWRGWGGCFGGKDALEDLREEEEEYEPCELDAEAPVPNPPFSGSLGGWIHGAVDFMTAVSDGFMALSTADTTSAAASPFSPPDSASTSALSSPGTPTAARDCASPFVVVPRVQGAGKRSSLEKEDEDEGMGAVDPFCGLAMPLSMAKRQRGGLAASFMPIKF